MTILSKSPARVSFQLDPAHAALYQQPQTGGPAVYPAAKPKKMSWWENMMGPPPPVGPSTAARPLPPTTPTPGAPASILAPAPASAPTANVPTPTPVAGAAPSNPLQLPPPPPVLTPFPPSFAALPRHERKLWETMRKDELRAWKEWERGCRAAIKADEERKKREGKEKAKREKVLEKQKAKEAKLAAKLGYRPLPPVRAPPAATAPAFAPANVPAAPTHPGANAAFGRGPPPAWNPTTWAHLPPLEEFGVRRPFDAPGRPGVVDIGGTEWPEMSRTMTHALTEMSMEERVHMAQAGHTWAPATGWYRD